MIEKFSTRITGASASDVGRVRDENQDACLVDVDHGLFVVADGMGGAQAGALASEIIVKVLPQMIKKRIVSMGQLRSYQVRRLLRDAIMELSQQVRAKSAGQIGLEGMGATVVLALIRNRWVHIAHMGDSRVYLLRARKLRQITDDHSIVGILLRDGEITPEQAKDHPAKGRLSRFVGMQGDVYPDVQTVGLQKGDRLLLCSDGLTGMVSDEEIATVLNNNPDLQEVCQLLVNAANVAGGKDNMTAIVVDYRVEPPTKRLTRNLPTV